MKLYRIRSWLFVRNRKGEIIVHDEIVVDNRETADALYERQHNSIWTYKDCGRYGGRCQMYEPVIHSNGIVGTYPKEGTDYIRKDEFDE